MRRGRITILAALLVILPLAALLVMSQQLLARQRVLETQEIRERTAVMLETQVSQIRSWIENVERPLREQMRVAEFATLVDHPLVTQPFRIVDRRLEYPRADGTNSEQAFLQRTAHVWQDKSIFSPIAEGTQLVADWGWHSWYWERGSRYLLWARRSDGSIVGAELSAARLLADLIAQLPDSSAAAPGEFAVLNHRGQTLYVWGQDGDPDAVQTRHLPEPFADWQLGLRPGRVLLGHRGSSIQTSAVLMGVAALALAIIALALVMLRELTRAAREAQQRVTFVNQVSHELKTPLTNIRMYAEMVEARERDERGQRYMGVIVSETHRLGRMIANVLSFARQQRDDLKLQRSAVVVDHELAKIAEQFEPLLEAKGISLTLDLAAPETVLADADVLAQIVGNLLSNAEKYGEGSSIYLQSRAEPGRTQIKVRDGGPGVAVRDRERIFEPFVRVREGLSDSAGTGIGLPISRVLARRHGGDLVYKPGKTGAIFVCSLATPTEKE